MTGHEQRTVFREKSILVDGRESTWYDLEETTSTMDCAGRMCEDECRPWTVISAETQLSGRGTKGRTWYSPRGRGFWISIILPSPESAEYMENISILAAQALIESLKDLTGLRCTMKHPNDVLFNGRKVAGILCESRTSGETVHSVILGMGINFLQTREDFEQADLYEATSLFIETGRIPEREALLRSFLGYFKPRYEKSVLKAHTVQT